MKIFVIGAGSVGAFLAARLSSHAEVCLVTRAERVADFASGIEVEGARVAARAFVRCASLEDIGAFPDGAVIFLTGKAYQLSERLAELRPLLGETHTLVFCQNGLGILDEAQGMGLPW